MKMVGHKTQAIYQRYAIADESILKDAAEKRPILLLTGSLRRPVSL